MMADILGIDLGTTAVKAASISMDGRISAPFRAEYATTRGANGVVTQDALDWLRLTREALAHVSSNSAIPPVALGLCSQVNTHVFVGADGMPLAPAFLWQDTRATAEAAELDAQLSDEEKIALLGAPMPIDPSHALPRMLWMSRHAPELWEQTQYVMLPKDFVLLHLTGQAISDPLSNVGLVGPDLRYAEPLFDLVSEARAKMADLAPITAQIGTLKATEPCAGTPVINGTMDAWAGLVGAGASDEGRSVYLSGTSEILGISSRHVTPTPGAIVFAEAAGLRLHAAPTQNGGDAKLWACDVLHLEPETMGQLVSETPRGPQTPLFLPQLGGERAPIWRGDLRAAYLNVGRTSGPGDFARAVYEGVAFQALWAMETLEASAGLKSDWIACGGGGFRSDAWAQIRADVFGRPLHRLAAGEPGVLGAAALAGLCLGIFPDLATAQGALSHTERVFEPDREAHEQYQAVSAIYRDAIDAHAEISARLQRI